MPLERDEEDRSRVYWSVPSNWFPKSRLLQAEEVPSYSVAFVASRKARGESAFLISCLLASRGRRFRTRRSYRPHRGPRRNSS